MFTIIKPLPRVRCDLARLTGSNLIFPSFWLGNGSIFQSFLPLMAEIFLVKWFPPVLNLSCFCRLHLYWWFCNSSPAMRTDSSHPGAAAGAGLQKGAAWPNLRSQDLLIHKSICSSSCSLLQGLWGGEQERSEGREALFTLCWVHSLARWKTDGKRHFQPSCWSVQGFTELCSIAPDPCII